jgi:lipid-A-disaccharide synthase-like uncharacterized protein
MDFLNGWVLFGFLGQAAFSARFIVQWIISEKNKESTIPIAFWYLSLIGGLILFIYALYKKDPVFVLGQGSGLIVYIRNLILIKKKQQVQTATMCRERKHNL